MNIGIFDSGFGGLSVLKHITSLLPQYSYVYLGDNARAPYGDRSQDVIYEYTKQGVEFLFKRDCAIVLLACNTASTLALRRLQQEWLTQHYPDRKILGVIIPIVETLAQLPQGNTVGIIGTRATIHSDVYAVECAKRASNNLKLIQRACPLLVPLIEEGWEKTIVARKVLKKYLAPFRLSKSHALVLACTHYALMLKTIQRIMGRTRVIEAGPIVARSFQAYLKRHSDLADRLATNSSRIFYTTDHQPRAQELAARFWRESIVLNSVRIEGRKNGNDLV